MYPSVKEVIANNDYYTLFLVFDNGESGILDMKPILSFGIFRRINDLDNFKRVRVSFDAIERECGVDLDPEYIYPKCRGQSTARHKKP